MLTTKQIAFLRSQAHHLNPTVMIGMQGLTESIITKISNELEAHELIKVKFLEFKEQKRELAATIVEQTSCDLVTIIGNIAVLYREPRDLSRKKINLPV
jgi:RNA-binding protein